MKTRIISLLLLLSLCSSGRSQPYQPTAENLQSRQEFRDSKFGIFLHWGLYCMLATGEWTMTNKNLNYKEYAKLAGGFYPSRFNAAKWVAAIKASGAKYICFTSRHHEGFSMFHTRYSDYNIVDATPFRRDVLKELADECHKQGIRLHLYYSHIDWYREDAPQGRTGRGTGRPDPSGDWNSYYAFMNNQLTELLTGYGKIGAIWFDGWWDQDRNPGFDWQLPGQYALIHRLQPACLIGNNHHRTPFEGEDIQIFERDLPGENKAGLSGQGVSNLPLETCETMNGMWGYKITDQDYKSTKTLIHYLVKAAGKNANLQEALYFNGHWETFGGINWNVNKKLSLGVSVINIFNEKGAKGTISGSELITKQEAGKYEGKYMSGSYLRPFTVEFSAGIKF